jgi:RHS repeat-associated protein
LLNGVLEADVVTATDYYPFGMSMPGRKFAQANSNYRFGFNGKEKDNSTGESNIDFGARIYDGKLGRWLSVDLEEAVYPSYTTYNFVLNCPIFYIDPDGNDVKDPNKIKYIDKGKGNVDHLRIMTRTDVWKKTVEPFAKGGMYDKNKIDLEFVNNLELKEPKDLDPLNYPFDNTAILGGTGILVKISGQKKLKDITTITQSEYDLVERFVVQVFVNEHIYGQHAAITLSHETGTHALTLGKFLNDFIEKKGDLRHFQEELKGMVSKSANDPKSDEDHKIIGSNTGVFQDLNLAYLQSLSKQSGVLTPITTSVIKHLPSPSATYYYLIPDNILNRAVGVANGMVAFYNTSSDIPNSYPKHTLFIDGSRYTERNPKSIVPEYKKDEK